MKKLLILFALVAVIGPAARIGDDFFEISKNLEIFSDLYKNINLYYADDTQPGELMKTGIDAMLSSLDPYTTYIPESRIEDYRFMTTGQYGGIGSLIREMEDGIYISEPYQGYPAEKAGLMSGDRIVKVDGKSIEDKDQQEVSEFLKGSPGSTVKLEIERQGGVVLEYNIKREEIKIPDVPYKGMLDDKTGYIKLNGFTQTASKEVKEAYKLLEGQGMSQLVLDLRGNGGGLLNEAVNIVNIFVPRGTEIVSTRGNIEEWDKTYKALNEPLSTTIPLVVLIDGGSASASEIVSGTLQDLDRAVIVGQQSFGKGLVQQTKDIAYGSKLKLTVAKYYTPSGRCIQKLDYFHKSQLGDVEEVPDSLVKEFRTANGRPVFDGRGIGPDVVVDDEELGEVIIALFTGNYFFKYATVYKASHPNVSKAEVFSLTDEEIDFFIAWVDGKEVDYETDSQEMLKKLIKATKEERYYDQAKADLDDLEKALQTNVRGDILKYKDQVRVMLESEIISRYEYQDGRTRHGLKDDPFIEKAIESLKSDVREGLLKG
ncbi:MAG: S41 family peptidase [Bacteroidetes bacterium]|nr:S41 family peptidase [Bacteroidota bacterium]